MKKLKEKIKETNKLADDLIKDAKTSNSPLYEWLEIDFKTVPLKNGHCENCGNSGPFIRVSDGSIYLEVHHNIPLSSGGRTL